MDGSRAIRRIRTIGGLAGFTACVLVAGGVVYAHTFGGDGLVGGNFIGAGHLVLQVNDGQGSDLSFANLTPGEQRSDDQLITADMAGVGTAALTLTLSGASAGAFTNQTSLTVRYSDPEPAADIGWSGGTCTSTAGYGHSVDYPSLAALATTQSIPLKTLTGTDDGLCVQFVIELDTTAGNDVQGTSATFAFDYNLEQTSASTP